MKMKEMFEKHQKEAKRIDAEEKRLNALEDSYRTLIKGAEGGKKTYNGVGNWLLTRISKRRATQTKQEAVINQMKEGLRQIEKRKQEIDKLRREKEKESAKAETTVRMALIRSSGERAEIRRQQQSAQERQEIWDKVGADFGETRIMKRRRR